MKASLLSLASILLASLSAQEPMPAEPTPTRPAQKGVAREQKRPGDFWKKADANQDKIISRDEFLTLPRIAKLPAEKQEKLFSRLDKNANGSLEGPELRPSAPPQGAKGPDARGGMRGRIMPRIAELDVDQDRKISFEEFTKAPMVAKLPEDRQRKMFEQMDRNDDGFLSPDDGPPQRPGPPRDGRPQKGNVGPNVFERLDANKDQSLDFAEFQKFPPIASLGEDEQEDRFQKIDANTDAKIDAAEWKKHLDAMSGPERKPKRPKDPNAEPQSKPQPPAEPQPMDQEME
jgi:Ca2+-binding EF-hand superfamily protein